MKTILKTATLSAILLILTGTFISCDEKENPPEPFLTIDESPITATAEVGAYSIEVSSNGAWTAVVEDAENHEWCTLTNTSGSNDGAIIVNIAKNPLYTTRSATVKIILGSFTKSVIINQEATEENKFPCDDIVIIVSNQEGVQAPRWLVDTIESVSRPVQWTDPTGPRIYPWVFLVEYNGEKYVYLMVPPNSALFALYRFFTCSGEPVKGGEGLWWELFNHSSFNEENRTLLWRQ